MISWCNDEKRKGNEIKTVSVCFVFLSKRAERNAFSVLAGDIRNIISKKSHLSGWTKYLEAGLKF